MWQGVESHYDLMTEDEMREALIGHAGDSGPGQMGEGELERAERHFPGIFDEDA
jgi:hypothetical protein